MNYEYDEIPLNNSLKNNLFPPSSAGGLVQNRYEERIGRANVKCLWGSSKWWPIQQSLMYSPGQTTWPFQVRRSSGALMHLLDHVSWISKRDIRVGFPLLKCEC